MHRTSIRAVDPWSFEAFFFFLHARDLGFSPIKACLYFSICNMAVTCEIVGSKVARMKYKICKGVDQLSCFRLRLR
jgi:hypothetical protein